MKLEQAARQVVDAWDLGEFSTRMDESITALREALAEQAEQEPVVKYYGEKLVKGSKVFALLDRDLAPDTLLYAAPVRTKDLTEDEIIDELNKRKFDWVAVRSTTYIIDSAEIKEFARAVIAADREKNRG